MYSTKGDAKSASFAAIWEQDGGLPFHARHNLTGREYQQTFDQLVGQRFRLRVVNGFDSRSFFTLSHFTFAGDISAENRDRLIDCHRFALTRISGCNNLSAEEKESLNEAYRRAIHHTTLNEAGVNASAQVGGSQLNVNSATLVHNIAGCNDVGPGSLAQSNVRLRVSPIFLRRSS